MGIQDIALEFLRRGGKQLRPRLCKAVFAACSGMGDIAPICEAVECFHKASLIHDDIQDADETRYGRPTVWKEHGVALAIAAGDWLVARGYQLIAHSAFPNAAELLATTVDSHLRLCEGQADDLMPPLGGTPEAPAPLFDTARYLSVCERKTGEAFALAAQLGARAAGADDARWRRYGLVWGILFQINDDLADGEDSLELRKLKERYENEADLSRRECALGVW